MHYPGKLLVNAIALPSLVILGTCSLSTIALAKPDANQNQPLLISRLLPQKTVYDCGSAGSITLTRDAQNRDRFTYEAVNSRGQTLTLKNGVGYGTKDGNIYTFIGQGGSESIVAEKPSGKTTLTTADKNGANGTTFNCSVVKAGTSRSDAGISSSASESSSGVNVPRTTSPQTTPRTTAPKLTTGEVRGLW